MKKKENKKFNVLTWDFNGDKLEHYDVLPYFRDCYAERKKKAKGKRIQKIMAENPGMKKYYGVPATFDEFKEFIMDESRHRYWSRCEWEMIVHGWPVRKNDYKVDVHEQVMMNLDTIAGILWAEIKVEEAEKEMRAWKRKAKKYEPMSDANPFDNVNFPTEWPEAKWEEEK